jgi:hypothetical protein
LVRIDKVEDEGDDDGDVDVGDGGNGDTESELSELVRFIDFIFMPHFFILEDDAGVIYVISVVSSGFTDDET